MKIDPNMFPLSNMMKKHEHFRQSVMRLAKKLHDKKEANETTGLKIQ